MMILFPLTSPRMMMVVFLYPECCDDGDDDDGRHPLLPFTGRKLGMRKRREMMRKEVVRNERKRPNF